ncbi:MAG: hypothetical protein HFH30_11445 [Eubacterium sp.]|nr:hypothetical protein [Eubacterium sp.]
MKKMENSLKQQNRQQKIKAPRRSREPRWDKLDNTAHLFPVIAGDDMTNVYRISVTLKEPVIGDTLQRALDMVLPKFDGFNVRLRRGFFWYYFEENGKPAPEVKEEAAYPCRYIIQHRNNSYLFRVTYYKCRINLEVFHVLTDGMGGLNFLKELTYQYLRLSHPKLREQEGDRLSADTSLNLEDSFLQNYKKSHAKNYRSERAYIIKAPRLHSQEFGVMHGYFNIPQLKSVCKSHGMSINEYLVALIVWSIYQGYLHGAITDRPIRAAVPVNLRPYFNSVTTKNFFVVVSAEFRTEKENYTLEEVLQIVKESLRAQITKENLEDIFSYNVSNEKNIAMRAVPLSIKNIAIRSVYTKTALANTTTVTNIGNVKVKEVYEPYIEMFQAFLAMSKGQLLKGTICSYQDTLVFTFSSVLKNPIVQKIFFRTLAAEGIDVQIESNGVFYE